MDKRELAAAFRERLAQLVTADGQSVATFLRRTGLDRSALSQFLNPQSDRLPRAEALRRIAESHGVTTDWLLNLSNAPEGRQEVAPAVQIERASFPSGGSPLDLWRREAAGTKLRYVPSSLPDMLALGEERAPEAAEARAGQPENVLEGFDLADMDVEIAMPLQTLQDLAEGCGLWRGVPPARRERQLAEMARTCERAYPSLRLHLYDGRETFAAPFTVFGRLRAALYLGEYYLVITSAEQVRALVGIFDRLVRRAVIGPDRVHETLAELAGQAGGGAGQAPAR
ncbi:MAG: XRE family transcriptional regulator [Alphaproteobacteria bacterium]|nr:MAG: XRE family transcriptional regulator [Alphaproteobacteria bacterium]